MLKSCPILVAGGGDEPFMFKLVHSIALSNEAGYPGLLQLSVSKVVNADLLTESRLSSVEKSSYSTLKLKVEFILTLERLEGSEKMGE